MMDFNSQIEMLELNDRLIKAIQIAADKLLEMNCEETLRELAVCLDKNTKT